ncbi:NAD(P)/FAD-dependent oxidoreductase [Maribacter hydrothermalis]|uniref:FAD-dependent oxidoreductase n=1 Tax=Maribacter hydrothermalis TaxID=1836467 RepID=A0A1B7YXU6_9FLAO|nr:FAD-binding oxidoreductase [Maribacter hydrothermalis]APQ16845.1 FAD-dependent oxidoreductase [Maribacter hydrothermalis]OBR35273.1 FAD-dependent oxidoreductase [Maribacter hydrothermalis]
MVDYLVVGLGLAGTAFCETLRRNNKTFIVFNDQSQTSSRVAGGLYNPVILKRFTLSWRADEQVKIASDFYKNLEQFLNVQFYENQVVLRKFASIEEQNLWFEAADKEKLKPYLDTNLVKSYNKALNVPFGFGKVLGTGKLNTKILFNAYVKWLKQENILCQDTFDYNSLVIQPEYVEYKGLKAKNIVFADGFGLMKNPFFNYLPMQGSKGEYITIEAKDLKETNIIKSSVFLIPLGNDLYKVGATYNRGLIDNETTEDSKEELLKKLKSLLNCEYKVMGQEAGVRPTVKDRRPLVGKHPKHKNIWILNGFGSHGILIAPWASKALYEQIEHQRPLLVEMDIIRFSKN